MKRNFFMNRLRLLYAGFVMLSALSMTGTATAVMASPPRTPVASTDSSTSSTGNDKVRLNAIINAGNREISRRLTTLKRLDDKINGAAKLSASDKSYLANEVNTEISGLTTLKTKLDAETTFAGAKADAQSIFTDYRVYALIVPKVQLIRVANDQQVVGGKLNDLATKLQTRISQAQSKGKDVATLQTQLAQLKQLNQSAQGTSSSVEAKLLPLQPSDYNTDHSLLSGYSQQLAQAHQQNQQAYNLAKTMVGELKKL